MDTRKHTIHKTTKSDNTVVTTLSRTVNRDISMSRPLQHQNKMIVFECSYYPTPHNNFYQVKKPYYTELTVYIDVDMCVFTFQWSQFTDFLNFITQSS